MMFCINTVVTNHFEVLVRDMNNQAFYKINDGEAFCNRLVILMPGVMKRHGVTIVRINSGGSNNRSSEISADILNGDIRRAEIGFGTDIKTIRVILINLIFISQESSSCEIKTLRGMRVYAQVFLKEPYGKQSVKI